jgi:hypothetical protein
MAIGYIYLSMGNRRYLWAIVHVYIYIWAIEVVYIWAIVHVYIYIWAIEMCIYMDNSTCIYIYIWAIGDVYICIMAIGDMWMKNWAERLKNRIQKSYLSLH